MHGNVWEWCEDDYHDSYKDAPDDGRVWVDDPRRSYRVLRVGSWGSDAGYCRSAYRSRYNPDLRDDDIGFRLVCLPGQQGEPSQ